MRLVGMMWAMRWYCRKNLASSGRGLRRLDGWSWSRAVTIAWAGGVGHRARVGGLCGSEPLAERNAAVHGRGVLHVRD